MFLPMWSIGNIITGENSLSSQSTLYCVEGLDYKFVVYILIRKSIFLLDLVSNTQVFVLSSALHNDHSMQKYILILG